MIRAALFAGAAFLAAPVFAHPGGAEAEVMAAQRALVAAVEARDRAALEEGIAEGFALQFVLRDGASERWGATTKDRVIARWTTPHEGGLPTLVLAQKAVVRGDTGTVFACIVDRSVRPDGMEERLYSRVADTFARTTSRWLWTASLEVQVTSCGEGDGA